MSTENSDASRDIQDALERELGLRGIGSTTVGVSRSDLERTAFVCAGAPGIGGRRNGAGARLIRKCMFKLTRWYVEPFVLQQRSFNLTLVRYIAGLEQRIAELEGEKPSGKQ
jgi:hypothetical protein